MLPLRWLGLAAGAWLLAALWVLFRWYKTPPTINDLGVGAALVVLAFLGGKTVGRFGGGWRALVQEERSAGKGT
jgi:hypothetical protein